MLSTNDITEYDEEYLQFKKKISEINIKNISIGENGITMGDGNTINFVDLHTIVNGGGNADLPDYLQANSIHFGHSMFDNVSLRVGDRLTFNASGVLNFENRSFTFNEVADMIDDFTGYDRFGINFGAGTPLRIDFVDIYNKINEPTDRIIYGSKNILYSDLANVTDKLLVGNTASITYDDLITVASLPYLRATGVGFDNGTLLSDSSLKIKDTQIHDNRIVFDGKSLSFDDLYNLTGSSGSLVIGDTSVTSSGVTTPEISVVDSNGDVQMRLASDGIYYKSGATFKFYPFEKTTLELGSTVISETGILAGGQNIPFTDLVGSVYRDYLKDNKIEFVTDGQVSFANGSNITGDLLTLGTTLIGKDNFSHGGNQITWQEMIAAVNYIKGLTPTNTEVNTVVSKFKDVISTSELIDDAVLITMDLPDTTAINKVVNQMNPVTGSATDINKVINQIKPLSSTAAAIDSTVSMVSALPDPTRVTAATEFVEELSATAEDISIVTNKFKNVTSSDESIDKAVTMIDSLPEMTDVEFSAAVVKAKDITSTAAAIDSAVTKVNAIPTAANITSAVTKVNAMPTAANVTSAVTKVLDISSSATDIDASVAKTQAIPTATDITNAVTKVLDISSSATDIDAAVTKSLAIPSATDINNVVTKVSEIPASADINNTVTKVLDISSSASDIDASVAKTQAIPSAADIDTAVNKTLSINSSATDIDASVTKTQAIPSATDITNTVNKVNTLGYLTANGVEFASNGTKVLTNQIKTNRVNLNASNSSFLIDNNLRFSNGSTAAPSVDVTNTAVNVKQQAGFNTNSSSVDHTGLLINKNNEDVSIGTKIGYDKINFNYSTGTTPATADMRQVTYKQIFDKVNETPTESTLPEYIKASGIKYENNTEIGDTSISFNYKNLGPIVEIEYDDLKDIVDNLAVDYLKPNSIEFLGSKLDSELTVTSTINPNESVTVKGESLVATDGNTTAEVKYNEISVKNSSFGFSLQPTSLEINDGASSAQWTDIIDTANNFAGVDPVELGNTLTKVSNISSSAVDIDAAVTKTQAIPSAALINAAVTKTNDITASASDINAAVTKSQAIPSATDITNAVTKVGNMPSASDVTSAVTKVLDITASASDINAAVTKSQAIPSATDITNAVTKVLDITPSVTDINTSVAKTQAIPSATDITASVNYVDALEYTAEDVNTTVEKVSSMPQVLDVTKAVNYVNALVPTALEVNAAVTKTNAMPSAANVNTSVNLTSSLTHSAGAINSGITKVNAMPAAASVNTSVNYTTAIGQSAADVGSSVAKVKAISSLPEDIDTSVSYISGLTATPTQVNNTVTKMASITETGANISSVVNKMKSVTPSSAQINTGIEKANALDLSVSDIALLKPTPEYVKTTGLEFDNVTVNDTGINLKNSLVASNSDNSSFVSVTPTGFNLKVAGTENSVTSSALQSAVTKANAITHTATNINSILTRADAIVKADGIDFSNGTKLTNSQLKVGSTLYKDGLIDDINIADIKTTVDRVALMPDGEDIEDAINIVTSLPPVNDIEAVIDDFRSITLSPEQINELTKAPDYLKSEGIEYDNGAFYKPSSLKIKATETNRIDSDGLSLDIQSVIDETHSMAKLSSLSLALTGGTESLTTKYNRTNIELPGTNKVIDLDDLYNTNQKITQVSSSALDIVNAVTKANAITYSATNINTLLGKVNKTIGTNTIVLDNDLLNENNKRFEISPTAFMFRDGAVSNTVSHEDVVSVSGLASNVAKLNTLAGIQPNLSTINTKFLLSAQLSLTGEEIKNTIQRANNYFTEDGIESEVSLSNTPVLNIRNTANDDRVYVSASAFTAQTGLINVLNKTELKTKGIFITDSTTTDTTAYNNKFIVLDGDNDNKIDLEQVRKTVAKFKAATDNSVLTAVNIDTALVNAKNMLAPNSILVTNGLTTTSGRTAQYQDNRILYKHGHNEETSIFLTNLQILNDIASSLALLNGSLYTNRTLINNTATKFATATNNSALTDTNINSALVNAKDMLAPDSILVTNGLTGTSNRTAWYQDDRILYREGTFSSSILLSNLQTLNDNTTDLATLAGMGSTLQQLNTALYPGRTALATLAGIQSNLSALNTALYTNRTLINNTATKFATATNNSALTAANINTALVNAKDMLSSNGIFTTGTQRIEHKVNSSDTNTRFVLNSNEIHHQNNIIVGTDAYTGNRVRIQPTYMSVINSTSGNGTMYNNRITFSRGSGNEDIYFGELKDLNSSLYSNRARINDLNKPIPVLSFTTSTVPRFRTDKATATSSPSGTLGIPKEIGKYCARLTGTWATTDCSLFFYVPWNRFITAEYMGRDMNGYRYIGNIAYDSSVTTTKDGMTYVLAELTFGKSGGSNFEIGNSSELVFTNHGAISTTGWTPP